MDLALKSDDFIQNIVTDYSDIIFRIAYQNLKNKPENKLVDEPNNPSFVEENNEKYLDSKYLASLPKLNVFNEFGGMGFGAYMAYSIDELKNGNPWTDESNLKTMPVFKNKVYANSNTGIAAGGLTGDEMLNKGKKIAQLMKLSIKESYTIPTEEENKIQEEKTGEKANTNPYNTYESDGSLVDRILNYNFNDISFVPTDNRGELASIYINSKDLSDLIGNYPIITADEAKELLLNGEYIANMPKYDGRFN